MSLQIRDDARLAGQVIRYHTWPHLRQQSVGEHSWQVARIIMSISTERYWAKLLPHAITHDIGEIGTGDVPYPVKKNNPELSAMFHALEQETMNEIENKWQLYTGTALTDQERWVFKLAEFIEMWEWGLEETLRGNKFAEKVVERCIAVVVQMLEMAMDESVKIRAEEYVMTRQKEWGQ